MTTDYTTDKPLHHLATYHIGFSVRGLHDQALMNSMLNYSIDAAKARLEHMEQQIFNDMVESPKAVTTTRRSFREWLANKLHNWSLRLDPSLMDDYYY